MSAALALGACRPSPDLGAVQGGIYRSKFFRMSFRVPESWVVEHPPAEGDRFLRYYLMLLAAKDKKEDSPGRVRYLIRLSSLPIALAGPEAAVITVAAAFVEDKPNFSRGRAAMLANILLDHSPLPVKIEEPFHAVRLGGLEFDAARFAVALKKDRFHEEVYVTLRRGYALVFGVVAKSDEDLKKAGEVLASLRFEGEF